MNFFEQQDRAKRNSGRLILLLALAVICLIAATTLALGFLLGILDTSEQGTTGFGINVDWSLLGYVALTIISLVVFGSLYKNVQLSAGGKAVAERLGGRLISLSPQGFQERQILNVVGEMSIASGTPVPPVYLIEDDSINAFAAGLTPQDAVIGITRGAINLLSREELQGVIAHEFSHIFHGDMRLNTRLVALLHGILLLGLIGKFLLHTTRLRMGGGRGKNNIAFVMVAGGLILIIFGYVGTFFGHLIRSAVSRQREFLADAAAVQFTRNPDGIGGALKKIGGYSQGSQLSASHAEEFSHMYFGDGTHESSMWSQMATHPPLEERIRRIDPHWNGEYPQRISPNTFPSHTTAPTQSNLASPGKAAAQGGTHGKNTGYSAESIDQAINTIGTPLEANLQSAREMLLLIPAMLKAATHSRNGAQALVYGLLLNPQQEQHNRQLELLRPRLDAEMNHALDGLYPGFSNLDERLRLPLLDLAIPALKELNLSEREKFKANLLLLIETDGQTNLTEWIFLRIVERNLQNTRPAPGKYKLEDLHEETAALLSALAYAGHDDETVARQAFAHSTALLSFDPMPWPDATARTLSNLDTVLNRLDQLWPLQKPMLLKAMAKCIEYDGQVTVTEAELMRAVADTLSCPIPPLLGQESSLLRPASGAAPQDSQAP